VHNDDKIAVWGGPRGLENLEHLCFESKNHGRAVFELVLTQAAAQLVVNKSSCKRLWRPLPFTADDCMLPAITGATDHELLVAKYDWEANGGCNALARLPKMARFPGGWLWQVARQEKTAKNVATTLFSGSWRALHNGDFTNLEVLPHSVWLRMFGAEGAIWEDPGNNVVFTNPNLNAPGTIRAIRTRNGVITRGTRLTVVKRYLLTCASDLAALIETSAQELRTLFWPEKTAQSAPTTAIVAFARRMGVGPIDPKRKREFEANLKIRVKADRKLLPCAYTGRFVGQEGVMQCASLNLCGQTPREAATSTPGHVLAKTKAAPPCMLNENQEWKNGVRYECALHVQAAAIELSAEKML
tara:strand:+ start:1976 stop:3046 length:1071 start_codon:yes stop_codon:yes gene_type:complete